MILRYDYPVAHCSYHLHKSPTKSVHNQGGVIESFEQLEYAGNRCLLPDSAIRIDRTPFYRSSQVCKKSSVFLSIFWLPKVFLYSLICGQGNVATFSTTRVLLLLGQRRRRREAALRRAPTTIITINEAHEVDIYTISSPRLLPPHFYRSRRSLDSQDLTRLHGDRKGKTCD